MAITPSPWLTNSLSSLAGWLVYLFCDAFYVDFYGRARQMKLIPEIVVDFVGWLVAVWLYAVFMHRVFDIFIC